jgi:hypothetical protein
MTNDKCEAKGCKRDALPLPFFQIVHEQKSSDWTEAHYCKAHGLQKAREAELKRALGVAGDTGPRAYREDD